MLLDEFSTIFDRPEKVKKLREYILSLAVRGKLVPQDENDEPASVLLERIREEKDRLVKEKKIKKEKPLPEISEDEITYELPKGWKATRLIDITHSLILNDGDWILSKNMDDTGKVKLIQLGSIGDGEYINKGFKLITDDTFNELKCREIDKGDILINRLIGKKLLACILPDIDGKKITSVDTCFIKPNENIYDSRYLLYTILSPYFQDKAFSKLAGTTRQRISKGNLISIVFALPPLNEQKRIVEKVDYLMAFCDKLEAQLEKKVKYGALSAKSALNSVSNCSSYEELEEALRFIIENFKDLTLSDGAVRELKNAILSLAVKGKLVPQDESDEPASILLERIREEKERLVKEKKIKKEKPLPEISEDEIPYELPKGWEWVRLMDIVALNDNSVRRGPFGSAIKKDMFVPKGNNTCKIYEQKNAIKKDWKLGEYYISNEKYEELKRFEVVEGDIIISCAGTIGETYVLPKGIEKGIINQALLKIRLNEEVIDNEYFINMFKSLTKREINESAKGSAMKNLVSIDYLKSNVLFPLAPINEQKRIVEKVDKLMKVCDELELRIEKSKKYSERLMESILKDSFKA